MKLNKMLESYHKLRNDILTTFDYSEFDQGSPITDLRTNFWKLTDGDLLFSETEESLNIDEALLIELYSDNLVHRGEKYTLVEGEYCGEGYVGYCIFDNELEVKDE